SLFDDTTANRFKPIEYEKFKSHLNTDRSWKDKLEIYQKTGSLFLKAAWQTIKISFLAMIVAVVLGLVIVCLRLYGPKPFKYLTTAFVELIRGTPLLLQLFFIFYALPGIGIEIPALWAAVMALGINYSVQESEIYRSGLINIHKNQIEAARMLGLNPWQTFWAIQVPQAIKFCLGPMTTDFIALIKDSSLVSVITLVELTKTYSLLSSTYYEYIGFALVAAGLYMLIGMPLVLLSRKLERSLAK
ncbi:MAG: amino acid ABC transporter permease, partial [Bdellovibrionaceae bacterium]|nr:amino acid ABC transporter permease [Pseudobdellovibrionaceae bacterium]